VGFSNVQGIAGIAGLSREPISLDGRLAAAAIKRRLAAQVKDRADAGRPAPSNNQKGS